MHSVKVKMVEGGRIIVPAALRRRMGVEPGATLTMEVDDDGELRVRSIQTAVRRLQAYARTLPRSDISAVDELIAERRAEAARE